MFCLADNDIILKLTVCDLFDDALAALHVERAEVHVLPSARFVLAKVVEKKYGATEGAVVLARLADIFGGVQLLPSGGPSEETLIFEDTFGIHTGESTLFSFTATLKEEFLLATGDKQSLRALAQSPECERAVRRLAGRVICLEQIVKRCIAHRGFDHVRDKIAPVRHDLDKSVHFAFGYSLLAGEASVAEGLDSAINELRRDTGPLLMP